MYLWKLTACVKLLAVFLLKIALGNFCFCHSRGDFSQHIVSMAVIEDSRKSKVF